MNEGNAAITIDILRHILGGKVFSLTLTVEQTQLFLTWIAEDFGADAGRKAAETVLAHIKDTSGPPLSNGPQLAVRAVAEQFLADLGTHDLAALVAQETAALFKSLDSTPAERAARLAAADPMPKTATVTMTVYLRNPDVVATVLLRAGNICEGCGKTAPFMRLSNQTPYLEVHHRHRLADGGPDTVENAVALCPNCHREAHHGMEREKFRK